MTASIEQFCEHFGVRVWNGVHGSGFNGTPVAYVQFDESSGPVLRDIGSARNLSTQLRQSGLVSQASEIDAALLRSLGMRRDAPDHREGDEDDF